MAAILCLGSVSIQAQDTNNRDQNRDRGDRGQRGNFDPAQMRERMMGYYKEQLEVKDDAEWKAIEPLIQKVMEARMSSFGGGRMFGGRPPGGDRGGDRPGFGQPNPDADALQKAIDSKASKAEIKTALARYAESRKAKQAQLEKAQDDLRKILSVRQEAIATLRGLL